MKSLKSILYINFAPYDNAGMILNYLIDKYDRVYHFSFNFHYLRNSNNDSRLTVYNRKKIISESSIFQILPHPNLVFVVLPIRSVIFFFQILFYSISIRLRYGIIDDYFTVNAYTAWCGIVLKKLTIVKRTIFWVWDYYPPHDKSKVITVMRWLYWQFDKLASHSDQVIFLNRKLENLRKRIGIIPSAKVYPIISMGTNPVKVKRKRSYSLLFIGVLKRSQGLDLLIHNSKKLYRHFPKLEVHIIGTGPDEKYLIDIAKNSKIPFYFHGLMDIFSPEAKQIINNTSIGIAPYKPERGNVSYYGDPSKIKNYLSFGLPVITTNVFEFSKEIQKSKAGLVIPYTLHSFIKSVNIISRNYNEFSGNSVTLAKKYNYKITYETMFRDEE